MKNDSEQFQNENAKRLGITVADQMEDAKLCGKTLEEFQKFMIPHYELMVRDLDRELFLKDNPDYNPYEGWTQEEIDHFEDKFFKQPFDAISAEAMGLMKETEKAPPLDFEDVF